MSPPMSHAAKTSAADPTARAMSLVTRKMPVPMVSPMTIATADHRPSPRISSERSTRGELRLGAHWPHGSSGSLLSEMRWSILRPSRSSIPLRAASSEMEIFDASWFCGPHLRAIIESAMATEKSMLNEFAWDPRYAVPDIEEVMTPALVVYPEIIASNIERTLHLLGGDADRWRVHIKTAKLGYTLRMLTRARHPQFQVRDHARTTGGLRQRRSRCARRLSDDRRKRAPCARNRGLSSRTCAFPSWPRTMSK